MSQDDFSWLHLTDFHYGLNGQDCRWPTLREPFLEDVRKLYEQSGPWHAVFFTGDLVQSGKAAEFEDMQREVLDRLWEVLGKLGSGDAVLLAVPGNHDLQRPNPKADNAAADALLDKGQFDRIAEKFWGTENNEYRKVVAQAFAEYNKWWNSTPQRPKSYLSDGFLPGEFAHSIACGDRNIGIIGLNTTFLQLAAGDYKTHLVWHPQQIHKVAGKAIDDWLKEHDVCLLLTHQGPDWLTDHCRGDIMVEIAPAGRFVTHLYGHMHETNITYLSTGGGPTVRRLQGRSAFGMEHFGEADRRLQRSHGYAAGRIRFDGDGAKLRLWPRFATKGTGTWRFIADAVNAVLEDDGGTKPEPLKVKRKSPPTSAPPGLPPKTPHSTRIRIPISPWPEELAAEGVEMPDSMLLRPECRIVRFHSARKPLRDMIIGWTLDPDQQIKLRLDAGRGGAGKTRLLIEICDQLETVHGWRAGFADRAQNIASDLTSLLAEGRNCLIVLDYAESRSTEIVELVRTALASKNRRLIRVALLARDGGDWWNNLADAARDDKAVSSILGGTTTKHGPYRLEREQIEGSNRVGLFQDALSDFAKHKRMSVPALVQCDLNDDVFGNPLFIHLAALAQLRGNTTLDDGELINFALGHERSYWLKLLAEFDLPTDLLSGLEQAIALFTLVGGKRTAKEAKRVIASVPRWRDADANTRNKLFDLLRRIYSFDGGLSGLLPDILGETLVTKVLAVDDEVLDVALGPFAVREHHHHALTVLARVARRVPTERRWLQQALKRYPSDLAEEAVRVAMETDETLPDIFAEIIKSSPARDLREAIERLLPALPRKADNTRTLGVEVYRQRVSLITAKGTGSGKKRDISLFETFELLSSLLREKGDKAGAASAARNALDCAERVFTSKSESDRAKLASAISKHARALREIGKFQEALVRLQRAEKMFGDLAKPRAKLFTPDWARSLGNLGTVLRDVGRFEEAVTAAKRAEELLRGLAEKQPDAFTADWAGSLGNLGANL